MVVWPHDDPAAPKPNELITFYPSISNTILTMWIVMAVVLVVSILLVRGSKLIPGRGQNLFEWFYEFLSDFGIGIAGVAAQAVHPAVRGVLPAHPVLATGAVSSRRSAASSSCEPRRATSTSRSASRW